ncbi:hypothetical protein E4665_07880 [Sporolactobacillus shoreae]|uniref:Uncharacterized protein n=1 Tax=Sporolactobacillus shoreae TaxID=1465501 RepID=A0A4Z0GQM5_9BACL|nr:hypothetical protein [Sporolactobacillus shoreae]TGA98437.1 hypothetical protein E4665_07880 [Sporolactobacillus shoreae]
MTRKLFWMMMLIIATSLFIVTLFSNNMSLLLVSLVLALVVRIGGNKVLFQDFYKKRLEKVKRLRGLSVNKEADK